MLRACAFLSLTFAAIALGVAPRTDAKPEPAVAPDAIKVGIMNGMFKGIPDVLVKAGGQQFSNLFQKFTGLPGGVEGEEQYLELARKLNQNQIQLGVVHGFEWAWIAKQNPQLAVLVATVPAKLPQSCIVVNAKHAAMNPAGLKGANVEIPFNMKAHGFLFIEKLRKESPAGSFVPNESEEHGPEELLDEVAKGKMAAAALVDQSSLQTYQNNNPGKGAKLKVLSSSELFPPAAIIYNKGKGGLDEKSISKIRTGMMNANKVADGKAFLFLWNLKGFEEPSPAFEKLIDDCAKAYPPPARR